MCLRGGGSLKASLARVWRLLKSEQVGWAFSPTVKLSRSLAKTKKDNRGECDLGFNPHQEHYRQVNLPSVLSSPNVEGNGINSITNLLPYRPNALLTKCSTLVLRLAMNATARFCAKSSTLLASQARLFASKACFVAPLGLAFTMAEILLSLTIIGVVAAITLPSLTGNINERTWNTQRKALYSRISQAVALMPSVRGYGSISEASSDTGVRSCDDCAEIFLTKGLSTVLKMNNICDYEHLADCGMPEQFIKLGGGEKVSLSNIVDLTGLQPRFADRTNEWGYDDHSGFQNISPINTKAAAFETANGESIMVHYYPNCMPKENMIYIRDLSAACANFVYDLNGKKGPNTIGKDMGVMTLLYPNDSILVAPVLANKNAATGVSYSDAQKACRNYDNSRLPTIDDTVAFMFNINLLNMSNSEKYWVVYPGRSGQMYAFWNGQLTAYTENTGIARCVERN